MWKINLRLNLKIKIKIEISRILVLSKDPHSSNLVAYKRVPDEDLKDDEELGKLFSKYSYLPDSPGLEYWFF